MKVEIDMHNLKGIKIGDWVESACLKGYFKVYQIKPCLRDGKDSGYLLLLKKALSPQMKFSFSTEKCHVAWCEKLSESQVGEIEGLLDENPTKKKKFEEMPPMFPCIQKMFFLDIEQEQIDEFKEKLNGLPRYFTEKQFDDFVKKEGLMKHIKTLSDDPKNTVTLTIYSQEWIVDSNCNMLFCNPQIGNMWGKLAKLDAEEWNAAE